MIIGEMAKKSEAKSPAVVPPIVLTSAKITIVVSEPITTGTVSYTHLTLPTKRIV